MKAKLLLLISLAIGEILMPLCAVHGQNGPPTGAPGNPAAQHPERYGLPSSVTPGGLPTQQPPTTTAPIDPVTGLPMPAPIEWKDPGWSDPSLVLTNVSYDGLPVSEVAHILRDQFKAEFDILLPNDFGFGRQNGNANFESVDWLSTQVHLRLNNVKASEIFNAMNMLFENNRTPLRWELKVNGTRRLALLRVLEDPVQMGLPPRLTKRVVYFVGDLISHDKTGGMTMLDIVNTLSEIWKMTYSQPGVIQFHEKAELLIVSGTDDQNDFIRETLQAMRMKAQMEHGRQAHTESKTNDSSPKVQIR